MAVNEEGGAAPARLYAELLSNIRQVSVIASLDPPASTDTHASITNDGTAIALSHNGVTVELQLPAPVIVQSPLPVPAAGSKEASWRLSLLDPTIKRADDFGQDNIAPWSATSLQEGQDFSCRKCGELIVQNDTIQDWKDLPSENWAEMMDFWHCHKPHDHKHEANGHHEDKLAERGYGANTRFEARQGTGYVDLTYFLLSEEDCKNTKINLEAKTLNCATCDCPLGHPDSLAHGNRLSKWSLSSSHSTPLQPTIPQLISSTLLYLSTSQNIKKFLIHSPLPTLSLDIWLFAPLVTFSSTTVSSSRPLTATKLFYHILGEEETCKKRASLSDSIEEIEVPDFVVDDILKALKGSTAMLPVSARKIAGWEVGFLERFTS